MPMNLSNQSYQPVNIGQGFSEAFARGAGAVPDLSARVTELLSTSLQQQGGMERQTMSNLGAMDRTKFAGAIDIGKSTMSAAGTGKSKQDDIRLKIMQETANFARTKGQYGEYPSQEQVYAYAMDMARIYLGQDAPIAGKVEVPDKANLLDKLKAMLGQGMGAISSMGIPAAIAGTATSNPMMPGVAAGAGARKGQQVSIDRDTYNKIQEELKRRRGA